MRVFLAFFAFLAAFHGLGPSLPIYLSRLGSPEREIGVLVGTIGIAALISRLLVGRVLRRFPERTVMLWAASLFGLSFLALIVFRPFWPFFLVRLVQGTAFAFLDTAAIAYAVRIVPVAYRARAISYFLIGPSLASAVSAASGIYVVNTYGFPVLLFCCAGLCLCALFLAASLVPHERPAEEMRAAAGDGRLFQWKVVPPAISSFLYYFSIAAVAAFFPLYAIRCGVANPGYFFSASAAMLIAVRLFGGWVLERYPRERIIQVFLSLAITAIVIMSFSRTLPAFIFVGLLWGTAGGFFIPVSMNYALGYAGASDGTAIGSYQAFMDMGLAVGPAVMGLIVRFSGYRLMFLSVAFICLLNLAYFQFYLNKRKPAP